MMFSLLLLIGCNSAQSRKLARQNLAAYPWQFATPMPHGRYGHDAVYAANGKFYVMGGLVFKVVRGFKKGGIISGVNYRKPLLLNFFMVTSLIVFPSQLFTLTMV